MPRDAFNYFFVHVVRQLRFGKCSSRVCRRASGRAGSLNRIDSAAVVSLYHFRFWLGKRTSSQCIRGQLDSDFQ